METLSDSVRATAKEIASQLDETNPDAIAQIERVVQQLGAEKAYHFLQKTLEVEKKGGILTQDKSRRRTPGGAFFFIVRGRISAQEHAAIWPNHRYPWHKKKPSGKKRPPFRWGARAKILSIALKRQGEAATVKIKLVGRPGKIIDRDKMVITTMTSHKAPPLPKGLPEPPAEPTVYLVYIAHKQWRRVAEAIKDPEDRLIVEGYPINDKKLGVIGVLVQHTTTVALERAKREN